MAKRLTPNEVMLVFERSLMLRSLFNDNITCIKFCKSQQFIDRFSVNWIQSKTHKIDEIECCELTDIEVAEILIDVDCESGSVGDILVAQGYSEDHEFIITKCWDVSQNDSVVDHKVKQTVAKHQTMKVNNTVK